MGKEIHQHRKGTGKTVHTSVQGVEHNKDAKILEAVFVLVSMAAGDQDEEERIYLNLLRPSLKCDKENHDMQRSMTSTLWMTNG